MLINNDEWLRLSSQPNANKMLADLLETNYALRIIRDIMIPYSISHAKVTSNILYLMYNGDIDRINDDQNNRRFNNFTASIKTFRFQHERPPLLPRWIIATAPDIVNYLGNYDEEENVDTEERYIELLDGYDIDNEEDIDGLSIAERKRSIVPVEMYIIIIKNYLEIIKPFLETQWCQTITSYWETKCNAWFYDLLYSSTNMYY